MKMTKVASSNINAIGYSEALKQLHVEFKNGKTFAYTDVSKEEFSALTAAPSTGKHFIQHIKAAKECFEVIEGWQEGLIAKLQADNELLREALESMNHVLSGYEKPPAEVKAAISNMDKALAATAKG